jgi:glycosidase
MDHWFGKIVYHIYPFGMCGVNPRNDFVCPPGDGLGSLRAHIPRLVQLGVNAVYIGPLFESTSHGYDTVDYFHVDRRLGNNAGLMELTRAFHDNGIMVVLDGVFNHTGRDFFAFKDIQRYKQASQYADWYAGLDFSRTSPYGDPFCYESWAGHYSLVKLNSSAPGVRDHLFSAVRFWIDEFDIDGLRLDAANVLSIDFIRELSHICKEYKKGFWLMGETVAGDYRKLAQEGCLDSVTNYELYKGLWSSFNDSNLYEIRWTLNRQWGTEGLYPNLGLYNFADNHDVNRVASMLKNPAHLFPLYGILFTLPGIPSIYYGSEFGIRGERSETSDYALRPSWDAVIPDMDAGDSIFQAISNFSQIRQESEALQYGSYRELAVAHKHFAFLRETGNDCALAAVNAGDTKITISIPQQTLGCPPRVWRDMLSGETFTGTDQGLYIPVYPSWLRILR